MECHFYCIFVWMNKKITMLYLNVEVMDKNFQVTIIDYILLCFVLMFLYVNWRIRNFVPVQMWLLVTPEVHFVGGSMKRINK